MDARAIGVRIAKTSKRSQTGSTPSKSLPNDEWPEQTAGQMNINEKALHENPPVFMNVDDSETWLDEHAEPIISLKKSELVHQCALPWQYLTHLQVWAHPHEGIYSSDWSLLELHPQCWGCSGYDNVPILHVCSIWVVFWLLPGFCALQKLLPKVPPTASIPQGSEVDWKLLYGIMVTEGWSKLASWALWWFMPKQPSEHA